MPAPLGLYVHWPFCVSKCPYCDFNSHVRDRIDEAEWRGAYEAAIAAAARRAPGRTVTSIFFGGGTPSLMDPATVAGVVDGIARHWPVAPGVEVTLEANPGTAEAGRFRGYREAGVNRLSLGIQSFDDDKLKALGRIHSAAEARRAIEMAQAAFDNVNLDLMYGLPGQTLDEAQADVREALSFGTTHLSAYQLTIEPNTVFYSRPPRLPGHDAAADMQLAIEELAGAAGFEHYETSAFARPGRRCRHNLNYWEFGDYLGLGAGAHGKVSYPNRVTRHERPKPPREYLAQAGTLREKVVPARELPFEFMLNALRLAVGVPAALFEERTGLAAGAVARKLSLARERGLLEDDALRIRPSARGRLFLNELLQLFLD